MTKMIVANIDELPDEQIGEYLQYLPKWMRPEITRYRYRADQKSTLLGRLVLYKTLMEEDKLPLINEWKRDLYNKPFICNWRPFNIAHSGELVVFCYGDHPVGMDLEKKVPLNYLELMQYFQPAEQDYIREAKNIQDAFFEIWVKKEALLKAIGTGIVNGLHEFNCINASIIYQQNKWQLQSVDIHAGYTSYYCTLEDETGFEVQTFPLHLLASFNPFNAF